MTEFELGSALSLPHSVGKELTEKFFEVLKTMLFQYKREESMFKAMETLFDELLPYGKCLSNMITVDLIKLLC